ncbi:MAG: hypothetical protein NT166_28385 [Candidatus Aminicenantes bacterium]|nr:hypothetical protein [Candidatus Aminicenantes bacterium]
MTILSVKQNVGQWLKIIDRAVAKKLDYPVYREFIPIFLENLENRIISDIQKERKRRPLNGRNF